MYNDLHGDIDFSLMKEERCVSSPLLLSACINQIDNFSFDPLFIVVTRILRQRSEYHIKDTHFVS